MNEINVHNTPGTAPRFQRRVPAPALGLAGLPSFARALRQRGLVPQLEADGDEALIPALSIFAAHLRRRAMEQAFASLRGDLG